MVAQGTRGAMQGALRRGRAGLGGAAVLALALAAFLGGLAFLLPPTAAPTAATPRLQPPRPSPPAQGRVARAAEGDASEGVVADAEPSSEASAADAGAAPEAKQAPAPVSSVPDAPAPLFQELIVTADSQPVKLMKAIVGAFSSGARAVDLMLTNPQSKHLLMYTIARVPEQFKASAHVLTRRRDRRLRIRVVRDFRPQADENPEAFRISKMTNYTKLADVLKSQFTDMQGNNKMRSVKLEYAGKDATATAINVIENVGRILYRELSFVPRYVEKVTPAPVPAEGEEQGEAPTPKREVFLQCLVTAD